MLLQCTLIEPAGYQQSAALGSAGGKAPAGGWGARGPLALPLVGIAGGTQRHQAHQLRSRRDTVATIATRGPGAARREPPPPRP